MVDKQKDMWGDTQDFPLVILTKRNHVDYGQDH